MDIPGNVRPTRYEPPRWAAATGFFLICTGLAGLIASSNGIGFNPKACVALALAGFVTLFGYDFVKNGAINRMNYVKVALKYLAVAPLLKGAQLLVRAYGEHRPSFGLAGAALLYLAWLAYYYGDRFYQNLDAVEIGRRFGFEPAKSGLFAGDWIYDSAGEMNGVQALFNIDVVYHPGGRYSRGSYTHELAVLCYCDNPAGLRLRVRAGWTGFWSAAGSAFRVFSLPQIERPPQWRGEGQFRANLEALVINCLARSGADTAVFSGAFRELWLSGGELKAVFKRGKEPWTEQEIRKILDSATRLAAAFGKT